MAKGSGSKLGYKYKDAAFANGPCKVATVKDAKVLKVLCRAAVQPIAYSLDEPAQVSVGVNFAAGGTTYCAVFGGTSVRTDSSTAQQFSAKDAQAPGACPTPPAACP